MQPRNHWEDVYRHKASDEVSWYQPHADVSLDLIRSVAPSPGAHILDVGAGASTLVDDLLAAGLGRLSVLDISEAALDIARHRLGPAASQVNWLVSDVTQAALPAQSVDVWHDRAVFHFLIDPADRAAYVAQVRRAVRPGGHVIVATFGPQGPSSCSGLPVARYSPNELHSQFGEAFELKRHVEEEHRTPGGAVQHFVYCHCLMH